MAGWTAETKGQGQGRLPLWGTKALFLPFKTQMLLGQRPPGLTQEMLNVEKGAQVGTWKALKIIRTGRLVAAGDQASVSLRNSHMSLAPSPEKLGLSHGGGTQGFGVLSSLLPCR